MLTGVKDGLAAVRSLHYVVLRAPHAVRCRSSVQHKFAAPSTSLSGWQKAVVTAIGERTLEKATHRGQLRIRFIISRINAHFLCESSCPYRIHKTVL